MVADGVGTSTFSWGTAQTQQSSLTFTGSAFFGNFETEFKFGNLSFTNGTINTGTGANSVDLIVTLSFLTPSGVNESFSFPFQLINTVNTNDPVASADAVKFQAVFDPTKFFTVDNIDYTLQFTRFGNVGPNGFITTITQFNVLENESASADMFGKLTAHPSNVPEPTSIFLFGAGLIGLCAIRRCKKN